ncbi:hypothetical protein RHMOL_Rhmol02G0244300 [Rhododendron molle]|uniref:Uncharacterized protein n=1 Tax=Rhododendron molle TaxID=49168 RepID=A0ACC0PU28_RHOML|nr:hypothetical protein RHMOL_Rhmol02G0244300 [Rhododendron molle]
MIFTNSLIFCVSRNLVGILFLNSKGGIRRLQGLLTTRWCFLKLVLTRSSKRMTSIVIVWEMNRSLWLKSSHINTISIQQDDSVMWWERTAGCNGADVETAVEGV